MPTGQTRRLFFILVLVTIRFKFEVVLYSAVIADDYGLAVLGDGLMKEVAALAERPSAHNTG